jgi:predicted RNA-binding Zn ribbon-like protein
MGTAPKLDIPFAPDLASYEEAAARIRELNERLIASSKAAGSTTLEAYEKALESMLGLEEKVAGASQLEWVSAIAQTHAKVVRDISSAYAKAAREMLSGVPGA